MATGLMHDFRYATRTLLKSRGFSAAAVLTMALGIGANTAVFSVVHAILLSPLPYDDPETLLTMWESNAPNDVAQRFPVSPGNFLDWRERSTVFESIGAFSAFAYNVSGRDAPERVVGAAVSASLMPMLGLKPALGRPFEPADDAPDAERTTILSHGFWTRRFGADPHVIGRTLQLNGQPHTIVGVMPAGVRFPEPGTALWVPLERQITRADMRWRSSHYLAVVARLRPGVSLERARDEMNRINAALKRENPDAIVGAGVAVLGMQDDLVREARPALLTLLAAVSGVLLIACANLGNLLLVRATQRSRELALRTALGAGRWRLARLLLIESVLLAMCGAIAGLPLAGWTRDVLLALSPDPVLQEQRVSLDPTVILFTMVVAAGAGVLFGLIPAFAGWHQDPHLALRSGGGAGTSRRSGRIRHALVAAEIALAVVLVSTAMLLVRSFIALQTVDAGFKAAGVVTAQVSLPGARYPEESRAAFFDRALEEVRRIPGVRRATAISNLPLTGNEFDNTFSIPGRPTPRGQFQFALIRFAAPQYFEIFGIPIRNGRGFSESDTATAPPVAIVSEAMASRYWPGTNAVGQRLLIEMGAAPVTREIVGVAADVRTEPHRAPEPMMYVPYRQLPVRTMVIAAETQLGTADAGHAIAQAVRRVDPDQPTTNVRTMDMVRAEILAPWRFSMTLVGAFAVLALVLAVVGVFGVLSQTVLERTRELGLRMALGASAPQLVRFVVWAGMSAALAGAALGLAGTLLATRWIANQLYGVTAADPVTLALAVTTLLGASAAACMIPARRAARIDPLIAIRGD